MQGTRQDRIIRKRHRRDDARTKDQRCTGDADKPGLQLDDFFICSNGSIPEDFLTQNEIPILCHIISHKCEESVSTSIGETAPTTVGGVNTLGGEL